MFSFKKSLPSIIIIISFFFILLGCDTSEPTDITNNVEDGLTLVETEATDKFIALYKKENKVLRFEAIQKTEVIQSSISYGESNMVVTQISIPKEKKEIPKLVNQAASVTQEKLAPKKASISTLSNLYTSFLQDLDVRMPMITKSKLANTVRYHWSIINSAERIDSVGYRFKGENKPCTTYAGFTEGSDPFVCLEDMVMKMEIFEKRLIQRGLSFSDFGIEDEIENLKQHKKTITGKEFSDITQKNTENTRARYPYPCSEGTQGCNIG